MTESDKDDLALLSLANENGKFAIQLGGHHDQQEAFERGIGGEWFRFVDLSPIDVHGPGTLFRIFVLTDAGRARRAALKSQLT